MGHTYAKNRFIVCLKFSDLPGHPMFCLSTLLLWKPSLASRVKFMALIGCGRGAQCFLCYERTQGYRTHKSQGHFKVNWMPHAENGWGTVPVGEAERFSGVEVKPKSSPGRTPPSTDMEVTTSGEATAEQTEPG